MDYSTGVDVGSVSINCAVIDRNGKVVYEAPYARHFGLVFEETHRVLKEVFDRFGEKNIRSVTFTGVHGELLSKLLSSPFEIETIAQVIGVVHVAPGVKTIISIGGQDASLFQLVYQDEQWYLDTFNMNGPCASGTGSFIDQQAERLVQAMYGPDFHMDQNELQKTLQDFIALGLHASDPASVACRCTVFTKSDMIHLQNKGEPLPNIIAGLHYGNAANYVSTIVANRVIQNPILFIGGMASNRLQVQAFQHYFPGLAVPRYHTSMGAIGVGLRAMEQNWNNRIDLSLLEKQTNRSEYHFPRGEPLDLQHTVFDPDNSLPIIRLDKRKPIQAFLGVDIGSTSTKYALINDSGEIIHKYYVPTRGKPIEVTQLLIETLSQAMGSNVVLLAVATTGSGRNVVGDFLNADLVIDEITAHARGAVEVDSEVDTIFEIGGQDSKYIRIDRTHPVDFDMNKVCAAGTGSFLHELANKMKINIVGEFQEIALAAKNPVHLAERCTVFMESDLVSFAQKGVERNDLIAGLCYAIVYNYLNRVVGKRFIGRRIMFLGGPSLNKGIVAAFERILGRHILVPKHREVLGAYGAALLVKEKLQRKEISPQSRNLNDLASTEVKFSEIVCRADKKCHNECKLKVYKFGDRKSVWGGDCGRYEVSHYVGPEVPNFFKYRNELFLEALEEKNIRPGIPPVAANASKPIVGIPLALHSLEWGIFWTHIFSELGFPVHLSPFTNGDLVRKGLESLAAETCFPVKVFQGHVHYLLDQAEYLFLPNVINMPTPASGEAGFFCPLVESSQYMARTTLNIRDARLIRPTLYLKAGSDSLINSLHRSFPKNLRPSKRHLRRALEKAWQRHQMFRADLFKRGEAILQETPDTEAIWIVSGRPYNLYDERVSLQLGRHLAKRGIKALPMDYLNLEEEDLSDFPRMYWGLGARILRTAKRIALIQNWYGVHLTNFSCGADSFLEHFYRHVLQDKPSLILELDEHTAVAGLLTRVEAYQNVVKNLQERSGSIIAEAQATLAAS
jgi:predicted CoA-substrate-specific enzyme activase